MLLINSSQYYNVMALIFINYLYGVNYLPFNHQGHNLSKITK